VIWNNIVYNTSIAGIRFGGTSYVRDLKLYNNTFYNTVTLGITDSQVRSGYGAITNEMNPASNQLLFRNNIFWPAPGTKYVDTSNSLSTNVGIFNNNLWFGAGAAPSFDINSQSGNPNFVAAGSDFHLVAGSAAIDKGSSAVASVVLDDFDVANASLTRTLRPLGATFDIGAYEYAASTRCMLDLDGDGRVLPTTDGLMIARLARNQVDMGVTGGIKFASTATRKTWTEIQAFFTSANLDIDGDGAFTPTDALIVIRAALGLTSVAVTNGITFNVGATRKNWFDIRNYLVTNCAMTLMP
jgi:hypothetical protein